MDKRSFSEVLYRMAMNNLDKQVLNQCLVEMGAMQTLTFEELLVYWGLTEKNSKQERLPKSALVNLLANVVAKPLEEVDPIEIEIYRRIINRKQKNKLSSEVDLRLKKILETSVPYALSPTVKEKFEAISK